MPDTADKGDDVVVPFIFVPLGATPPADWLAEATDSFKIPATMQSRASGAGTNAPTGTGKS
jgi:hypothetical protein